VVTYIMQVMNPHFPAENLYSPLLTSLLKAGIRGGQKSDGSQKDGIFRYEKGKPVAVFDLESGRYMDAENFRESSEVRLGPLPKNYLPWKQAVGSNKIEEIFSALFQELKTMDTAGARLALAYARRSKEIGRQLVSDGIARSELDVNTVLLTGFFHALGPIHSHV
jgi:hypothetical protein